MSNQNTVKKLNLSVVEELFNVAEKTFVDSLDTKRNNVEVEMIEEFVNNLKNIEKSKDNVKNVFKILLNAEITPELVKGYDIINTGYTRLLFLNLANVLIPNRPKITQTPKIIRENIVNGLDDEQKAFYDTIYKQLEPVYENEEDVIDNTLLLMKIDVQKISKKEDNEPSVFMQAHDAVSDLFYYLIEKELKVKKMSGMLKLVKNMHAARFLYEEPQKEARFDTLKTAGLVKGDFSPPSDIRKAKSDLSAKNANLIAANQ